MISEYTITKIKDTASIVDVIESFVTLKKSGTDYEAKCPFHREKTASFKVSSSKQIFKCFGCGKSGDAISFLQEHEKMDYMTAIKWLAEKFNIEIEESLPKIYAKPVVRLEKLNPQSIEYFEGRGISNNTLLRFGLTQGKEYMPQYKQEVSVVCFNYYRGDDLINIKFRGPNKAFALAKDAELIFYNLNSLIDETTAIICEGEIDCLSFHEAGIHNCVSVPNGAAPGKQRLQYLDNCWQYFENKTKIILAVDGDAAGNSLKEELARRLGLERCFTVTYPDNCKDCNDVLQKHGVEGVKKLISEAKEYPLQGIINAEDLRNEIEEYYVNGYPKGAKAFIPNFDEHLSFVPGQLTMVTGIPGSGKDEFVNLITTGLARFSDWKFGICGFEEPAAISITKLQEKIVNKAFAFRQDPSNRINRTEFDYSLNFINDHYFFINVDEVGCRLEDILNKAAELVKRKGINAIVINPWNCLEHKRTGGMSETEYTSECLSLINNFNKKYSVHTFLLAHPTKIQKDKATKKYEIPTLYNISGSAHFFNKTHNGISIYRDFETNQVEVYIQKVKCSWLGKLGSCSFIFNTYTREYLPI